LAVTRLTDADPMVRLGALDMLQSVPQGQLWPLVSPLLSDASRGVRIRAAALLAAVPSESQPAADRERFERAAAEFIAAQRLNADRPESRTALADFFARRRRAAEAETEYRAALRISPHYTPAAINLGDLYRQLGRDSEGEGVLRAAIAITPLDAGLHYALGLTLTRMKQPQPALEEFRRATELEPDRARYAYVYAVALHSAGQADSAIAVLKHVLVHRPNDRDTLLALVNFSREAGDVVGSRGYAEQLARLAPDDQAIAALVQELQKQTGMR
jgi:tetratricopeptide (TPR) repeat protein